MSTQPRPAILYPKGPLLCKCGHAKYVHTVCFTGPCVKCECEKYTRTR